MEKGVTIDRLYVCDTYNHRIMRYRLNISNSTFYDYDAKVAAGGCLQSPSYIGPCIEGGLHSPPDPAPDRVDQINPSNTNPPIYHFWGPTSIFVSQDGANL